MKQPSNVRLQKNCVADYARIARRRPGALDASLLRMRSLDGREVLGHLATGGSGTMHDILSLCERYRDPRLRGRLTGAVRELDLEWALTCARVIGLQQQLPEDHDDAMALYEMLADLHGFAALGMRHGRLFADLLIQSRRFEQAADLVDSGVLRKYGPQRRVDLMNPWLGSPFAKSESDWLAEFNDLVFAKEDRVKVLGGGPTPFDGLTTLHTPEKVDGPLISVVMTSFRSGSDIFAAVRSILDQSWRNLELIVVDDCSGPEFDDTLNRVASLSSRIRVMRQPVNGGTYVARNAALLVARGEFVTFQDSDDWSHPRRLQRQAEFLVQNPEPIGTLSHCVRLSSDLVMCNPGYLMLRPNASSLMFRRREVLASCGYFDSVRKAADTEFHRRIEAVTGRRVELIDTPLALIRLRTDSLSRSDFAPGWHHKARTTYRTAYATWHRRIIAGRADGFVGAQRIDEGRPFPAPVTFLHGRAPSAQARRRFDVVIICDLRKDGPELQAALDEVTLLHERGLTVGLCHMESLRFMSRQDPEMSQAVMGLAIDGAVELVLLDDDVEVDTVIVRSPSVMQYLPLVQCSIRPNRVLVFAQQAPCNGDDTDHRYEIRQCSANIRAMFGRDGVWVAEAPSVRMALKPLLPEGQLHRGHLPPTFPGFFIDESVHSDSGSEPFVIGILYSTEEGKRRARVVVDAVLEAAMAPRTVLTVAARESNDAQRLRSLTVLVSVDEREPDGAHVRLMVTAGLAGALLVADSSYREVLGTAAVYTAPDEVQRVIDWYANNPEAHRRKLAASRSVLKRRLARCTLLDDLW